MTAQSSDFDLTPNDLDKLFPLDVESKGRQSMVEPLREASRQGKTLREAVSGFWSGIDELGLLGTPRQIADKMVAAMDYIGGRSEGHTSELQSLMRISYAVFCLKKKTPNTTTHITDLANQ